MSSELSEVWRQKGPYPDYEHEPINLQELRRTLDNFHWTKPRSGMQLPMGKVFSLYHTKSPQIALK